MRHQEEAKKIFWSQLILNKRLKAISSLFQVQTVLHRNPQKRTAFSYGKPIIVND